MFLAVGAKLATDHNIQAEKNPEAMCGAPGYFTAVYLLPKLPTWDLPAFLP